MTNRPLFIIKCQDLSLGSNFLPHVGLKKLEGVSRCYCGRVLRLWQHSYQYCAIILQPSNIWRTVQYDDVLLKHYLQTRLDRLYRVTGTRKELPGTVQYCAAHVFCTTVLLYFA